MKGYRCRIVTSVYLFERWNNIKNLFLYIVATLKHQPELFPQVLQLVSFSLQLGHFRLNTCSIHENVHRQWLVKWRLANKFVDCLFYLTLIGNSDVIFIACYFRWRNYFRRSIILSFWCWDCKWWRWKVGYKTSNVPLWRDEKLFSISTGVTTDAISLWNGFLTIELGFGRLVVLLSQTRSNKSLWRRFNVSNESWIL